MGARPAGATRFHTLLRVKPSKGGDTELRGYRDPLGVVMPAGPPAQSPCSRGSGLAAFVASTPSGSGHDVHSQARATPRAAATRRPPAVRAAAPAHWLRCG